MRVPLEILPVLADSGLAQWRAVVRSLENHMSSQRELIPTLALLLLLLSVLIANLIFAKWISRHVRIEWRKTPRRPGRSR